MFVYWTGCPCAWTVPPAIVRSISDNGRMNPRTLLDMLMMAEQAAPIERSLLGWQPTVPDQRDRRPYPPPGDGVYPDPNYRPMPYRGKYRGLGPEPRRSRSRDRRNI